MPEKKRLQNKFLVVMIFAATLIVFAIAKIADRYPEFPNPQDTVEHNSYHFNIINIDNTVLTVEQIESLASSMAKVWQLNYPDIFQYADIVLFNDSLPNKLVDSMILAAYFPNKDFFVFDTNLLLSKIKSFESKPILALYAGHEAFHRVQFFTDSGLTKRFIGLHKDQKLERRATQEGVNLAVAVASRSFRYKAGNGEVIFPESNNPYLMPLAPKISITYLEPSLWYKFKYKLLKIFNLF